jgi:hypothetical protein
MRNVACFRVFDRHRPSRDTTMKTLLAATAAIGLLAAAGPVSAQMYSYPPMNPPPMQTLQPPTYMPPPAAYTQQPTYTQQSYVSGTPSWMQDDGSSSDHPIHNPGDHSGSRLNTQYQGGLTVPAGQGLPAMPGQ